MHPSNLSGGPLLASISTQRMRSRDERQLGEQEGDFDIFLLSRISQRPDTGMASTTAGLLLTRGVRLLVVLRPVISTRSVAR